MNSFEYQGNILEEFHEELIGNNPNGFQGKNTCIGTSLEQPMKITLKDFLDESHL